MKERQATTEAEISARPKSSKRLSESTSREQQRSSQVALEGSLRLLLLYDVAEEIDLDKLNGLLAPRAHRMDLSLGGTSTPYIRFHHAPVVQDLEGVNLQPVYSNAKTVARYYSFGVVVLQYEVPFQCGWQGLIEQANSLERLPEALGNGVINFLDRLLQAAAPAIARPNPRRISEKFLIVNLKAAHNSSGEVISADELKTKYGGIIVTLLRNEDRPLADEETQKVLADSLTYYQSDLIVITSSAALIYDRPEEAAIEAHVIEFAKLQLVEFRYYDSLLKRVLDDVYATLEKKRNVIFARWTLPREARRFNRIRIDIMELRERVDSAVKFVSDIFYARVYHLAARRMGVPEYRDTIDDQLHTIGELYGFMVDQFNEARTFVLEMIAAVLALIDVFFLLRGK